MWVLRVSACSAVYLCLHSYILLLTVRILYYSTMRTVQYLPHTFTLTFSSSWPRSCISIWIIFAIIF